MRIETTRTTLAARLFQRDMARDSQWSVHRFAVPACVADAARPLWMRATALIMVAVTYFAPAVFLADEVAHAAPIVDPRAPIAFQPSVTQTSTGVPAVNIPAANGNGISVGQYQSFDVDSRGLVLNNSTVAGTPLLGGTLGANPNLNGRPASTIINQVTSNAIATLNGPLEVFGAPATVIVAAPGGVSVNGMSLTNAPGVTLTTGTPQFLTGVGGTATDFAHAGAVAYDVRSGAITIDGPAGVNGPGAGIEGTVGNIDLIGQSVSINAPLRADQRVNVVTGNQIVTPMATDATGTTYGMSSNGTTNTAAAIGRTVAVDANQFGSVTSGTVYIVSTAAGMGVNTQGPLSATAGNVVVNSNGDIAVGQTFANQNVTLTGAGNTTLGGTGFANQNYTVNANGDINAPGSMSAGQNVSMAAGGNLNAASVVANGAASLTAGQSMTIGALTAHDIALQTTNGDLTVGGLSAPGTVSAKAGRDLTVNGAVRGGSTVALTGGGNATVNGQVSGVGDTTIAAQTGSATVNGNAQSNGALSVTAGQNATIGGTVQAQGTVSIAAQGDSITGQGDVTSSQGAINLKAGQAIALTGAVQSGRTIDATAGTNANFGGTVAAPGAVTIQAGQDTMLGGNVTSGGNLSVTSSGNTRAQGTAASIGDMTLAANNGTLTTTGNVVSLGALNTSGQHGVNLGGTVYSGGNAQISSTAGSVAVAGALSSPGAVSINVGQDATIAGTVQSGQNTTITATRDVNLNGGLEVDNTGNASVTAGRDINGSGAIGVANDTTLKAGNNVIVSGAVQTGNNLSATAANNLSVGATTAVGNSTLTATNGSATLTGDALSGGTMTITAGTDVNTQGSVKSLGDLSINAKSGNLIAAGAVSTAGNATLSAGQNLALNGQTTVSKDATLAATNITTQGVSVGGNLTATASNALDTSAGQLNAQFDANAPALSVGGNATLSGANVMTANAVVGGTTQITGTQSVTTGGTAAFKGDATLEGGTVNNFGTQMVGGNLNLSGTTVTNSGALSSLQTATVNAMNLSNSGSIYGSTANLNVTGAATNSGSLLATRALNLTTGALSNAGTIFAGDIKNPTAATGDTTITVTGGNGSFSNTNGKILAQNIATLNLPNQTFDPSAATFGTVNGGNGLNLSTLSVNNSGTWTLPATAVTVTAAQGINNAGTINQGTGSLVLNSAVSNSGAINGNDLTINGSLANQASGTVNATNAFTLNGSGTNAGMVQADNELTISGTSYDNSGGTTRAGNSNSPAGSGNATINLSGVLGNAGGSLTATNDLTITANNVNNSTTTSSNTSTISTTIINSPLLMSTVIGTETYNYVAADGPAQSLLSHAVTLTSTLGGLLSPAGNSLIVPDPSGAMFLGTGQVPLVDLRTYSNVAQQNQIASGPTAFQPVATSGPVQFVRIPYAVNSSGASGPDYVWVVQDGTVPTGDSNGAYPTATLTIPTVTETRTNASASTAPSVIAAGHNLNLTANTLSNQGGTVSAGNDANLKLQSLTNGGTTFTSSVTDSVDSASLTAFMNGISALQQIGGIGLNVTTAFVSVRGSGNMTGAYCDGSGCGVGMPNPPVSFQFLAPSAVTVQSTSSSTTVQTPAGQILAGHDVNLSGGNLTNAGAITAGNNVNVAATSFTNQGSNNGTKTVTAGCAAGFSGCSTATTASTITTTNPNSETYSYQQTNSTVTAGNDIVIAASQVSNTYGNLVAKNNVVIGGAGTTAGAPTQAASVANTSGAIEAGNDVQINAATLTNAIAAPVQVHQNYGSATPFTGCTSNCEAYVDVKSADPATITANHDVNLTAGTFSNTGSLVTALNNVTINAANAAGSSNQYLNAYWASNLTHLGTSYPAWGCANNPALCQQLYGSVYSSGNAQDPAGLPSAVGMSDFVPGTIQAGTKLTVNSPTLTNTGNVIGTTVQLTGAQLVNGITNPNVYTPPPAVSEQVISLGPTPVSGNVATTIDAAGFVTNLNGQRTSVTGAAGLPSNSPVGVQTVGKPTQPSVNVLTPPNTIAVTTIAGETVKATYLTNNPAAQVVNTISSASLIAALPVNLRPSSVPFYYDPYTESQQVEQAALQATGKSSFYSTTSATDSTSQASIENQDKAALYGAALEYAKQNNIALGTQLSQTQLAQINAPMLWYVEQTVPEPGCTATGNGSCPTVQALMPEVLLPQNYAVVNADGEITGKDVTLNFANSILNTGTVTAETLHVNTNSLTNEQRSTNVGTIYDDLGNGVSVTTGTVVQQGGFMSAANYDLQVQSLNQIGGALQQLSSDGSVNQAATAQLLSNLKSELGGNFTQSTVSNDLHTQFIADDQGIGQQLFMMAAAVMLSVITAGAGAALVGAVSGTLEAAVANAGFSALVNTTIMDAVNGQFSLGGLAQSMGTAMLTAGLTNGITYNMDTGSLGMASWSQPLGAGTYSLAQMAGTTSVWGTAVAQSTGSVLGNLPEQALAIAAQSTIQAGVSSLIQGGSFLTALRNSAASNVAAVGANMIGGVNEAGYFGSGVAGELDYMAAHAILGCAASAASGTGCVGGAIGGATSALVAPLVRDGLYNGTQSVTYTDNGDGTVTKTTRYNNNAFNAITDGISAVGGGLAAALAGTNVDAGSTWALNEAMNNATSSKSVAQKIKDWAVWTYGDVPGTFSRWKDQLTGQMQRDYGRKPPPADANNQLSGGGNNDNTSGTAGAVVTPPVAIPGPYGTMVSTPPLIAPGGTPIQSSGGNGSDNSSGPNNFPTTDSVSVTGSRSIDKAKSYENAVQGMYNNASFGDRQYTAIVDGRRVSGIADDVTTVNGKLTAVEAKFVDDWSTSMRNPNSPNGTTPWALAEQQTMVAQAQKYSAGFDGGVVYHTNSPQLAAYYSKVFGNAGITNFKFVITPTK
ncbi:filamentous hemagglutinin N-terminal domain-containing protein [Burkholderia stagnalis]|uniref:two-partner secretion domain-containing protein n=1 Tax=Burkholderia stagnalis TaxID=1503054 RepID=UPI0007522D6B|nr:filamentous hemagglutinin N-terminal domain-containing protein [Burkholderia stagnalis]KVM84608.1 filamentous hemagglutinin [Burkholderia stagnalis]